MLDTVDPIGQGVLISYLEFYNCCYDSKAICLGAMSQYLGSYWPTFTSN